MSNKIRILISKPGLDGHDKGAKIIALALKEAGMEVFYSGLHQTLDKIIDKAILKSVEFIGLSIMTGAHMSISKELIEKLKKRNVFHIKVLVGGVIPKKDIDKLINIGIRAVFPNGMQISSIIKSIETLFLF